MGFKKIDEEINTMIETLCISPKGVGYRVAIINNINCYLKTVGREESIAFVYGSTVDMLATEESELDICISGFYPKTGSSVGVSLNNVPVHEDFYLLSNVVEDLVKLGMHDAIIFSQAEFPFFKAIDRISGIPCHVVFGNLLNIERTNLLLEYLSLDKRVKPVLFALKQFIKRKIINGEQRGYPSSHVFMMMGLYFLMFVQEPPVIPCLHSLPNNNECAYPLCLTKRNVIVEDSTIRYHDCFDNNLHAEIKLSIKLSTHPELKIWNSRNKKSTSELIIEAFKWFSLADTIVKPKSIISKNPPIFQTEWKNDVLIFADVFNQTQNIGASCTARGAKVINKEFAKAHQMLVANSSFEEVLKSDWVYRPTLVELDNYFQGRKL